MCPPWLIRVAIGAALGGEIWGQAFYFKSSFLPSVFHRLSSVFWQQFSARRVNQRKSVSDFYSTFVFSVLSVAETSPCLTLCPRRSER